MIRIIYKNVKQKRKENRETSSEASVIATSHTKNTKGATPNVIAIKEEKSQSYSLPRSAGTRRCRSIPAMGRTVRLGLRISLSVPMVIIIIRVTSVGVVHRALVRIAGATA